MLLRRCSSGFSATSRMVPAMFGRIVVGMTHDKKPVTAEEMWKHLPGEREMSVHIAEFPAAASLQQWRDDALVAKWQRLIEVRNTVNAALEIKRQDKTIGTSLGARVTLRATGDEAALIPYHETITRRQDLLSTLLTTKRLTAAQGVTVQADFDAIERVLRITGYVNSDPDFDEQPAVANGASDLLIEVFEPTR